MLSCFSVQLCNNAACAGSNYFCRRRFACPRYCIAFEQLFDLYFFLCRRVRGYCL